MFQLLLAVIYLSFISLGLPDSLLGSAWPSIYPQFGVPVSYVGIVSMIIAVGTVVSSLLSDRLTRRLGTGLLTALSVAMTAVALVGFSLSHSFGVICLWAIPYGLGAGSVDASLNNYVALHYASRHMSWLHCMWGVGASLGPCIMGGALAGGQGWPMGYRYIAVIQIVLTAVLFASLRLWKKRPATSAGPKSEAGKAVSLRQIIRIPGAKAVMASFFFYCALEQTTGLWASSYLTLNKGVPADTAASFASLFFIGITVGRGVSGFATLILSDTQLVRIGEAIVAVGAAALLLPLGAGAALVGLMLIGLGCAPIYPSIIHATPAHFGADKSQAIIGVQMASAYLGTCAMPPLFGLIANHIGIHLLPAYLLLALALMAAMYEALVRKCEKNRRVLGE